MLGQLSPRHAMRLSVRGFSLIELMIVLALVGILASLAVPTYRTFLINQQLSSAASDFLSSMLQARSEALRLGRPVSILPTDGSSWTSGWYLIQVDNTCASTGTAFAKQDAVGSFVSVKTSTTNKSFVASSPSFTYSAAGFPVTSCSSPYYSGSMNGRLVFQTLDTGRERQIIVSTSGRARICDPSRETCTAD